MELEVINNGMFGSNSYVLIDQGEAVLIDAGVPTESVLDVLHKSKAKLKYILLTHGHIDHICTVDDIRESTKARVLIHEEDSDSLINGKINLSTVFMKTHEYKKADATLTDGEEITFGSTKIRVIHTPGHSKGGCCFLAGDNLFSGDTLFSGSIGRTDFHGGDFDELINSIKEKLFILSEDTKVYPGHGSETTIGTELRNNPFLK